MHKLTVRQMALSAMVAALYTVLTVALPIPQYQEVQFRVAECMTVLPFLFPWAAPGLVAGCFLANLMASPFVLDWVFGTLATALACFLTARMPNKWLAILPPVVCNAVIVGAEIAWSAALGFNGLFWDSLIPIALSVGTGELAVCVLLGLPLLALLPRIGPLREEMAACRLSGS